MSYDAIRIQVEKYYAGQVAAHGPTALGVDWNSAESQRLRFAQLVKVIDHSEPFTINDYGCGYGALVDYLEENKFVFDYCGFEISPVMVSEARQAHSSARVMFVNQEADLRPADYTVASGIFNVRLETPAEE